MADLKLINVKKVYPWESAAEKKKALANPGNLEYTQGGVVAVQEFNLEVADKEFIVLVGPSGCGKSTTLRMIAGLEDITSGEIYIGGELVNETAPKDRDIAMVFQNYALFPHMTVYENMAFALKMRHTPRPIIDQKVREAAEILGITEFLDRKPKALSGGQRQRVAIGRAIVREPKVFLMDEPLSNLDAKLRNQMRAEIIKLRRKVDTTFIYVTHDQTEAMTLGDRIVIMKDGFIQQAGTPSEVFNHPANLFVAGFIGTPQMNFFSAALKKDSGYTISFAGADFPVSEETAAALAKNNVEPQNITLGVRPEHLVLTDDGILATVDVCEMMGSNVFLHVTVGGEEAVIDIPDEDDSVNYKAGDIVKIGFKDKFVQLFDPETGKNLV